MLPTSSLDMTSHFNWPSLAIIKHSISSKTDEEEWLKIASDGLWKWDVMSTEEVGSKDNDLLQLSRNATNMQHKLLQNFYSTSVHKL